MGFTQNRFCFFAFTKMDAEKRADDFLGLKMQKNPIYNTQAKPTTNISMTTGDNSTAGHHLSHSDVKPTSDLHLRHYSCLLRFSPENGVCHPFPSPYLQDLQLLSHFFNLYLIYLREREREGERDKQKEHLLCSSRNRIL